MVKVLAIGAHIDDIELGCGGTLLKHCVAGDQITLAIIKIDDALGGNPDQRIQEQDAAAVKVNASWLGFHGDNSIEKIVGVLDAVKPDLIYFPYEKDHHQDHHRAFQVGMAIGRNPECDLRGYLVTTSYGYVPDYFSIIDIAFKKSLVRCFKSQVTRKKRYMDLMVNHSRFLGTLVSEEGVFAEGFVTYRKVWR